MKAILPDSPFRERVYATGGYVRDEILGVESKDLKFEKAMKGEDLTKDEACRMVVKHFLR